MNPFADANFISAPHERDGSPDFEGYCVPMFDGSVFLKKDGTVTSEFSERGVWQTFAEARAAMERAR